MNQNKSRSLSLRFPHRIASHAHRSESLLIRIAEHSQTEERYEAENDGDGLPEAQSPRDRGPTEHDRGQQRELEAVGLAVLEAPAAEADYLRVPRLAMSARSEGPARAKTYTVYQPAILLPPRGPSPFE